MDMRAFLILAAFMAAILIYAAASERGEAKAPAKTEKSLADGAGGAAGYQIGKRLKLKPRLR
jgi:hypothetical protein